MDLPSPASGRIVNAGSAESDLVLEVDRSASSGSPFEPLKPQFATAAQVRESLAKAGIWPDFWSSATRGMPMVDGSETPNTVVVNFVIAEPYRARGRVILTRSWEDVIAGLRFLPRLMDDYGKVVVVLTAVRDPVARKMYQELSGFAWAKLIPVPVTYPVEEPRTLLRTIKKRTRPASASGTTWVIDGQGIARLGALLGRGAFPQDRLIALGGPGIREPRHYSVRIGTPLDQFASSGLVSEEQAVLRGGLMRGERVDLHESAVQYDDDGFFFLPEPTERQLLSFLRPGFDRRSAFPAFAGAAIGRPDSHITASLRGEVRPCISCGMCEQVCPASIMPQVIHRYLYRAMPEEAVKAGLDSCVDCNLCSFVCPSKIELQRQFADAREQILRERLEIERASAAHNDGDEDNA